MAEQAAAGPRAASGPAPSALSPQAVVQLQRMVGNRAMSGLLAKPAPTVQRAVSPSASWPPAAGGPEETLIADLDAEIPNAEQAATAGVQTNVGLKTAHEMQYIQRPSQTTWGYVVEEKLDPLAIARGWGTQHQLHGARPDYYHVSNGIGVYADLTTMLQAGIGGNHITDKLQNAGVTTPNGLVAAADVTHRSQNPRGAAGGAIVLGNATLKEVRALQEYRRFNKKYLGKTMDVEFNPRLDRLVQQYGEIDQWTFSTRWKKKHRREFRYQMKQALKGPKPVNLKKRYATRSRGRVTT